MDGIDYTDKIPEKFGELDNRNQDPHYSEKDFIENGKDVFYFRLKNKYLKEIGIGFTILHMVSYLGKPGALQCILDIDRRKPLYPKFSILDIKDGDNKTPLHHAYFHPRNNKVISLLVEAYRDLDRHRKMDGKLLQELLDAQDNDGNTAIHHACYGFLGKDKNCYETFLILAEAGADLSLKNYENKTPLDIVKYTQDKDKQKIYDYLYAKQTKPKRFGFF